MSGADIRRIHAEDAAALAALHRAAMPPADGWTGEGLERLIAAPAARGWLAEADGVIAGFLLAFAAADEAEILALCVTTDHRRQGIARALLRRACADLSASGTTRLFLEVRASNLAARELYARPGFTESARRKAYYPDDEDAVVMTMDL